MPSHRAEPVRSGISFTEMLLLAALLCRAFPILIGLAFIAFIVGRFL